MTVQHADQGLSVLYVEDEPFAREQVARFLAGSGYSVLTAENGIRGLELYHSRQPDLVLTDIMMPGLSGLDMARAIRDGGGQCQIVVMTAFSDTDYLIDAIDIGVNQFVLKPVDLGKLGLALERCMNVIRMRRQLEELQEERLRTRTIEAVNMLAGGMAHDFNNLLQVIFGSLSIARLHAGTSEKLTAVLAMAEQSCGEARELSQMLLSLTRRGEAFMHSASLAPLISHMLTALPERQDIVREVVVPVGLALVEIDTNQICQLLENLLANAVEAMPQGGVLHLEAGNVNVGPDETGGLEAGEYVRIEIRDNGVGIPPENLPHIFDPYFTTKPLGSQKGMGLGLTLCHAIIRRHRGAITVSSEPGRGASFIVYLPTAQADQPASAGPAAGGEA